VLESEYTTLVIDSEYTMCLNPSLCLTYTTTRCYINLVGRVKLLFVLEYIILLGERECVANCSLEAFWFCYSILKSPKKIKTAKRTKKRQKKQETT
jgi:hypothetical protein